MKHLTYMIIGIGITVLFFALSCIDGFILYDFISFQGYTNLMYDYFPVIALITIIVAWGGAAIYYYAINSVKFDRWYHWLATLGAVSLIAPIACFIYNKSVFSEYTYSSELILFEIHTIVYAALLFIVASFSMRWWSSNCRHTPIPQ